MRELLTTTEAARIAGVGVTSIKRWADRSLIRVTQTPGGHRRVHRSDLMRFIEESSSAGSRNGKDVATVNRNADWTTVESTLSGADWADIIVRSDIHSLQGVLLQARGRLGSWYAVADEAAQGLTEIGVRWERGVIGALDEHIASEKLSRSLSSLTDLTPTAFRNSTCLMTCAPGDDHTLGLSFLEICLREANWGTVWVGTSSPIDELCSAAASGAVQMVGLSASSYSSDETLLSEFVERVGKACARSKAVLAMGGNGAWPDDPPFGYRFNSFTAFNSFLTTLR